MIIKFYDVQLNASKISPAISAISRASAVWFFQPFDFTMYFDIEAAN